MLVLLDNSYKRPGKPAEMRGRKANGPYGNEGGRVAG